jgi:hypothetical protein
MNWIAKKCWLPWRRLIAPDTLGASANVDVGCWPTGEACEATTQFPVTAVDRTVLVLAHFDVNDPKPAS